jgi:uncharacterized protein YaeQ
MARNATICKALLHIADINRHYYEDIPLTIAQHPSETQQRMMIRLLAYALHAQPELVFCKGISTDDEPDLWQKNLNGTIELWIDVGLPDESRIRKACNRAAQVCVYTYGGRAAQLWWQQNADKLTRHDNLAIIDLAESSTNALANMAQRNMELQCTIDGDEICLSDATQTLYIEHQLLYGEGLTP